MIPIDTDNDLSHLWSKCIDEAIENAKKDEDYETQQGEILAIKQRLYEKLNPADQGLVDTLLINVADAAADTNRYIYRQGVRDGMEMCRTFGFLPQDPDACGKLK